MAETWGPAVVVGNLDSSKILWFCSPPTPTLVLASPGPFTPIALLFRAVVQGPLEHSASPSLSSLLPELTHWLSKIRQ